MSKFGIGQAVRRVEDQRFTTGSGQFVADLALPRQCYGVAVLSPHAHAIIKRVDVSAAKAAPGVLCVLTGADAATDKIGGIPPFFMPSPGAGRPAFRPRARCCLPTASVASATASPSSLPKPRRRRATLPNWSRSTTRHLPARGRSRTGGAALGAENLGAMPERQRRRHDRVRRQGGGRCGVRQGQARRLGAPDQQPGHRQSDRAALLRSASTTPPTANTRSIPRRRIRTASARHCPRRCFTCRKSKIRVMSPDVGGGFGMKANIYPDDVLVLWASKRCGRPVKWTATRSESLLLDNHARDQLVHGRAGARRRTARFLAIRSQRLSGARRLLVGGGDRAAVLVVDVHSEPLRRADDPCQHQRGVHQHGADVGLSRRRTPGSDLSDRAAGRARRRA